MAKAAYVGIGGTAKKVKKIYVGVGGVAKKVKKAYIGVGGVAKLWFNSSPVLTKSTASIALSGGRAGTYARNRGTVFNNQAILSSGAANTSNAYIELISASLTKTSLKSSGTYTYGTQDARLSSYAIIGGNYSASNRYGRYVSLSTSNTVANLAYNISANFAGCATQTSSYALYFKLMDYDSEDGYYSSNVYKSINNSLTVANTALTISSGGQDWFHGCADSFGDTAFYIECSSDVSTKSVATITNSLTTATYAASTITGSSVYLRSYKPVITKLGNNLLLQGLVSASPYYRIWSITPSLTSTQIYSETSDQYLPANVAAGSTPSAAVFVGGGTSASYNTNKILALDESYTNVTNGMTLTNSAYNMQSCVHPLGNMVLFAGGGQGNTLYTTIDVITES